MEEGEEKQNEEGSTPDVGENDSASFVFEKGSHGKDETAPRPSPRRRLSRGEKEVADEDYENELNLDHGIYVYKRVKKQKDSDEEEEETAEEALEHAEDKEVTDFAEDLPRLVTTSCFLFLLPNPMYLSFLHILPSTNSNWEAKGIKKWKQHTQQLLGNHSFLWFFLLLLPFIAASLGAGVNWAVLWLGNCICPFSIDEN